MMSPFFDTASHFRLDLLWCSWTISSKHFAESGCLRTSCHTKNTFIREGHILKYIPLANLKKGKIASRKPWPPCLCLQLGGGVLLATAVTDFEQQTTPLNPSSLGSRARHLSFHLVSPIMQSYSTGWRSIAKNATENTLFEKDTCMQWQQELWKDVFIYMSTCLVNFVVECSVAFSVAVFRSWIATQGLCKIMFSDPT